MRLLILYYYYYKLSRIFISRFQSHCASFVAEDRVKPLCLCPLPGTGQDAATVWFTSHRQSSSWRTQQGLRRPAGPATPWWWPSTRTWRMPARPSSLRATRGTLCWTSAATWRTTTPSWTRTWCCGPHWAPPSCRRLRTSRAPPPPCTTTPSSSPLTTTSTGAPPPS